MGGVLSVPGGGGPAVEDVVALAESNDVPYAIPLPVNEVRLRLFQFCFVLLLVFAQSHRRRRKVS